MSSFPRWHFFWSSSIFSSHLCNLGLRKSVSISKAIIAIIKLLQLPLGFLNDTDPVLSRNCVKHLEVLSDVGIWQSNWSSTLHPSLTSELNTTTPQSERSYLLSFYLDDIVEFKTVFCWYWACKTTENCFIYLFNSYPTSRQLPKYKISCYNTNI